MRQTAVQRETQASLHLHAITSRIGKGESVRLSGAFGAGLPYLMNSFFTHTSIKVVNEIFIIFKLP